MLIINNWWEVKRKEITKKLGQMFHHTSPHQTTTIEKIILNSGVGQAINNKQLLDNTVKVLQQITGQKPVLTNARKSVINFKLRKGMPIGCKVTLRGKRVWNFLFELININLPQLPNFQGMARNKFDLNGNYNLGIDNLNIFPSVSYNLTFKNQGCQIIIVFTSSSQEENTQFLSLLGFPFRPT